MFTYICMYTKPVMFLWLIWKQSTTIILFEAPRLTFKPQLHIPDSSGATSPCRCSVFSTSCSGGNTNITSVSWLNSEPLRMKDFLSGLSRSEPLGEPSRTICGNLSRSAITGKNLCQGLKVGNTNLKFGFSRATYHSHSMLLK